MNLGLPTPPSRQQMPQSLLDWLEIATKGLPPPTQARIRRTIETCFAEAVESHLAKGLSESNAQAAALAFLGDAQRVAERLKLDPTLDAPIWTLINLSSWLVFAKWLLTTLLGFRKGVETRIAEALRSILASKPIHDLPRWVDFATTGLVPAAKARIGAEIQAHYAEALAVQIADGLSESDAQTAALADLGDVLEANRRFRQEHLTTREADEIDVRLKEARGTVHLWQLINLLFYLFMDMTLIATWAYQPASDWRYLFLAVSSLLFVLAFASLSIAAYILARRKPGIATTRRIYSLGTFKTLNLEVLFFLNISTMLLMFGISPGVYNWLVASCWGLAFFAMLMGVIPKSRSDFRVQKKLTSISEDEFPAIDPAA